MRWRVRTEVQPRAAGAETEVHAADAVMAMVRATESFGVVPASLHYETRADGTVRVRDPEGGHAWVVEPIGTGATPMSPPDRVRGPYRAALRKPLWSPGSLPRRTDEPVASAADAAPPNLSERLFELSLEIRALRDPRAAAAKALVLAMALVPCEAGCVLVARPDEDGLEFYVARGGAGDALVGRRVPVHAGIAGAAVDAGVPIHVADVRADPRHLRDIDRETGFQTREVLCVPVRSEATFLGVIELLNPRARFLPWHVDAAESLAATLADALAAEGDRRSR